MSSQPALIPPAIVSALLLLAQAARPEEPEIAPIGALEKAQGAAVKRYAESRKVRLTAQNQAFDALQKKILAAIAELKRDRRHRYLEIEDILSDAAGYAGQDIAAVGRCWPSRREGHVDLVNALSAVPVRIAGLPEAQRKSIESLVLPMAGYEPDSVPNHAVIVRGRLQGDEAQGYRIEASGFSDLGLIPGFGDIVMHDLTISQIRRGRSKVYGDNILTRRERLLAVLRELERDREHPYVEIEDLILNRARYSGRRIATVGVPHWEEGYLRSPYFDMKAGYTGSNHIPVLMTQLPLEGRKELLRNQYPPHLFVVRGQVVETAEKNYYVAASSCAVIDQGFDSPAEILKSDLGPLAPFDGDVKKFREKASYGVVSESGQLMDEFRDKLLAAIAALRKDRQSSYAEIEDIGLDPRSYLDRDIATIGVPGLVEAVGAVPHFALANKSFGEISLPVSMSGFSPEMKKEILQLEGKNIIALRGRFQRSTDQKYYVEASGYSDLGQPPPYSGGTNVYVCELLKGSVSDYRRPRPDESAMRKKIRDAVAQVRRGGLYRYVEFKDLLRSPATLVGHDIATVGVPSLGVAKEGRAHFNLYERWDTQDSIPVVMSRLPLEAQKGLFRIMHQHSIVLQGSLRGTSKGKYYLEAAGYTDLGTYPMSDDGK